MTTRYTTRVLFLIIILLLVTNVVMLFLFVFSPEKASKNKRHSSSDMSMPALLKDSVGFSEQQLADYQAFRAVERPKLRELFSKMRTTKEEFYKHIYMDNADSTAAIALADSIGMLQRTIDLNMKNYFSQVRKLCTEDQLPAYDSTIKRVIGRMTGISGRSGSRNGNSKPKQP